MQGTKKRFLLRNIVSKHGRAIHKPRLDYLVDNIGKKGLQRPIICVKKKKDAKRIYVIDGAFCLKAYKILNSRKSKSRRRKTIDVLIVPQIEIQIVPCKDSFFKVV